LKNIKDIFALKAVSQNLMHKNLRITDGVYGILSDTDVRKVIYALSRKMDSFDAGNLENIMRLLKQLLQKNGITEIR
jgi:hypothetical protein